MLDSIKQQFHEKMRALQEEITNTMQNFDPSITITEDNWDRLDHAGEPGGGGRTRAFEGEVFESAGVNTSMIFGKASPEFSKKIGSNDGNLWACGISLIIHPRNPRVPTVHANFRMIHAGEKFWFGGGADLTPYYPHTEDFSYFHKTWKQALDGTDKYVEYKEWCDRYFTNTHRDNEMRGIGGIFFDNYSSGNIEDDFDFVINLSSNFIKSYFPIVEKRVNEEFTSEDVDFQLHRHGRYVEFNLIHDRGTHFGLKTNGRTDSILISLPKRCNFTYQYQPTEGSPHEEMMKYYKPKNWV